MYRVGTASRIDLTEEGVKASVTQPISIIPVAGSKFGLVYISVEETRSCQVRLANGKALANKG